MVWIHIVSFFLHLACDPKDTKKENVPEKHLCKRPSTPVEMGKKAVKRAKVEIEPLRVNKQVS